MTRSRWCTALLLVLFATPAHAQLCRGGPSFATHPYQAAATAAFTDGARAFGGDFGVGGGYLFAAAGFASRHVDDRDSSATEVSGRVGVDLPINRTRRIFFCPSGSFAFATGPDIGTTDVSSFRVGVGGRVGVGVHDTPELMIVPTFGLDVFRERVAFEVGGIEEDEADGVGVASLGVGFILNRRLAIIPELGVPFSAADSDVTFSVRVAFGFGGTP
jgi:hypothetical protein